MAWKEIINISTQLIWNTFVSEQSHVQKWKVYVYTIFTYVIHPSQKINKDQVLRSLSLQSSAVTIHTASFNIKKICVRPTECIYMSGTILPTMVILMEANCSL